MEQKIKMYPVGQLRKQLSVMEKKKMSPKRIVNMLKLLTGCDVLSMLDGPGLYSAENFNQMRIHLGYRYVQELLQDVFVSELFYVAIENGNSQKVRWFASPVYLLEKDIEDAKKYTGISTLFSESNESLISTPDESQKWSLNSTLIQTTSSINTLVDINIIPPGRTATPLKGAARKEERSPFPTGEPDYSMHSTDPLSWVSCSKCQAEALLHPQDAPNGRLGQGTCGREGGTSGLEGGNMAMSKPLGLSRPQRCEIVDEFIRAMRTVEEAPTFDSLRETLIKQGETEENAKGIIGYLMTHTVRNHFLEQDRFFRASFEARKAWLVNLLYGSGADRRLTGAKKYYRAEMMRKMQTDARARIEQIRKNRPISPHEWMNNGKRYYQDPYEGVVEIPADAPPRPGENAIWSVYMLKWMER